MIRARRLFWAMPIAALACAEQVTTPAPEAPETARFRILFSDAGPRILPRLMVVSAFGGRTVSRDWARAADANTCVSLLANPCVFRVPRDAPVTLIAQDSPGLVTQPPAPVDTSQAQPQALDAVEFVAFLTPALTPMTCHDAVALEPGVCMVFAQSDTLVIAHYRPMRRVMVRMVGAGSLAAIVAAPTHLGLDPAPAANPLSATYHHRLLVAPDPMPVLAFWLPAAATIRLAAADPEPGEARFRGWQGCAGAEAECRIGAGAEVSVTAVFEYWDCSAAGLGVASRQLDPRCQLR